MTLTDTGRFTVLHAIRIKGFSSTEVLAEMTGHDSAEVERVLIELSNVGATAFRDPPGMWQLMPIGKELHGEELVAERRRTAPKVLDAVRGVYDRLFLPLNADFKGLCTEWQLRDGDPNDHADVTYDRGVIERLEVTHVELGDACEAFSDNIARFASYRPRFVSAIERLRDGELPAFAGVMCGSYHDVWMELHQDLILTLGVDRKQERSF